MYNVVGLGLETVEWFTALPHGSACIASGLVKFTVDTLLVKLRPFNYFNFLCFQVSRDGGKVLVHCVAGMSRSAALCLAYLVKHRGMTLRKAFSHLRACRPCVRPNSGFFRQLIEFEEQITSTTTVSMVHNSAARCVIPDVYEPEYQNTLCYQNNSLNRNFGRH